MLDTSTFFSHPAKPFGQSTFLTGSPQRSGRIYRHAGSCHMELGKKEGNVGD